MIQRRRTKRARVDYGASTLPKSQPKPKVESEATTQKRVRLTVFDRDKLCVARFVSPVCTVRLDDPHHLLKRSNPRTKEGIPKHATWLEVGVCRADHDAAHDGALAFDWPGKPLALPNADQVGNVTPRWVPVGERGRGKGGDRL